MAGQNPQIQVTTVNDTRSFHLEHDRQLTGETTAAMVLTANHDMCAASPGIMIARRLMQEWVEEQFISRSTLHGPEVLVIGPGEGFETYDLIIECCQQWQTTRTGSWCDGPGRPPSFVVADYSPELLKSPALEALRRTLSTEYGSPLQTMQADANYLERTFAADGAFDMIVANEMIGDLLTVHCRQGTGADTRPDDPLAKGIERLVRRYGLTLAAEDTVNLGAILLIEQIDRLLKPGGTAFVSEHSTAKPRLVQDTMTGRLYETARESNRPVPIPLAGHIEYVTCFDDLERAASGLQLQVQRASLIDFVRLRDAKVLELSMFGRVLERYSDATGERAESLLTEAQSGFARLGAERGDAHLLNLSNPELAHLAMFYLAYHPDLLHTLLNIPPAWYEPYLVSSRALLGQFEYLLLKKRVGGY